MNRLALAVVCWFVLVSHVLADLTIKGELKVDRDKIVRLIADGAGKGGLIWDFDEDKLDAIEVGNKLYFAGPPGVYKIKVRSVTLDKDGQTSIETARATVTIGDGKPPVPPGPDPGPLPPDPKPDDAPIKAPGFRVLILFESKQNLTVGQTAVMYGKPIRDWLKASCAKDKDNPDGAFRIWDKDADASAESKPWQDALKRQRSETPWIIISNGKSGYEGPLPKDANEAFELLKKWEK